jgi:hypothetical protein
LHPPSPRQWRDATISPTSPSPSPNPQRAKVQCTFSHHHLSLHPTPKFDLLLISPDPCLALGPSNNPSIDHDYPYLTEYFRLGFPVATIVNWELGNCQLPYSSSIFHLAEFLCPRHSEFPLHTQASPAISH